MNLEKNPPGAGGGGGGGAWSIVLESQLLPLLVWLASAVTPGNAGFEVFDFSHAARVAGSTGQTSAGVSESFAIFFGCRMLRALEGEKVDGFVHNIFGSWMSGLPLDNGRLVGLDRLQGNVHV